MKKIQVLFYILIHLLIQTTVSFWLINNYQNSCENKEFLTWDPELRYIYSLELLDSLRRFEIINFLKLILDTPTWPPLRNLFHLPLFGVLGHDPEIDVYLSLVEFLILDSLLTYIAWKFLKGYFKKWVAFFLTKTLYLSPALLVYSFSGMLEIQGGVFEILTTLFFLLYFSKKREFTKVEYFGLSFLGLYFTKYPYGYMFLLAGGTILAIQEHSKIKPILTQFLKSGRTNFIPLILAIGLAIVYVLLPETYLTKKAPKYFKFAIGFLTFLAFVIFFLREKTFLKETSSKIYSFLKWGFLPVGIWTFVHPDRFGSSSSTINHIQKEGHLVGEAVEKDWSYFTQFFQTLFLDIWVEPKIGFWLGGVLIFIFVFQVIQRFKKKQTSFSLIAWAILFIQVIQLTFFTPNHQARHVYHLVPLMILIVLLFLRELKIQVFKNLIYFSVILIWILIAPKLPKYFQTTYLCFSGQGNFYQPIRSIEPHLDKLITKDVYLINHIEEAHLHRVNVEYIIAKLSYNKGLRYYKKIPKEKNVMILVIGRSCSNSNEGFIQTDSVLTNEFCVQKFEVNSQI